MEIKVKAIFNKDFEGKEGTTNYESFYEGFNALKEMSALITQKQDNVDYYKEHFAEAHVVIYGKKTIVKTLRELEIIIEVLHNIFWGIANKC